MDVLTDLLDRARARSTIVRKSMQSAPWSMRLADPDPLTAIAILGPGAAIRLHGRDAQRTGDVSHTLGCGDIALIRGGDYTVADAPSTPCQVIIRNGQKTTVGPGGDSMIARMTAART